MKQKLNVVNAFIDVEQDVEQGGNPAGIVLDADNLTHKQKLTLAKKAGLSETAFVSASKVADFKLDFYTPTRQIAHCGHATVAVFSYLAQTNRIAEGWFTKETIDGNRKILIKNGLAYMEQSAPVTSDVGDFLAKILDSIGISEEQLTATPQVINTGNSFLILGVKDEQVLSQLKPDFKMIETISEQFDLIGYYIFTKETHREGSDAASRMFAPRYGINEESATGMAAGPLACYLYNELGIKKKRFIIEQGFLMHPASPSRIEVNLEIKDNNIVSLMAGGSGKLLAQMTIDV